MSRYIILIILNTPLVFAALINAVVSYKLGHLGKRRFVLKFLFWASVLIGLIFTETIYSYLYNEGLTRTEPLSLFDVLQITGIIYVFYLVNRLYVKVDLLERRTQELHQELSIRLSGHSSSKVSPKK